MEDRIIERAAQQALSEMVGYDGARAYYLMLSGRASEVKEKFSYSKSYRLMKDLFVKGLLAKVKPDGKDFFSYFLLPPSHLCLFGIDDKIIEFLEGLYIKNCFHIFKTEFSQIMLRDERGMVLFLLKHCMKEYAKLLIRCPDLRRVAKRFSNVKVVVSPNGKKCGLIDRFSFDFHEIPGRDGCDYVGFISEDKKYLEIIDREIDEIKG